MERSSAGCRSRDRRLSIAGSGVVPVSAAHQRTGGRKGALPEKDGENEGSSWDVYENKGGKTKCLVTNSNAHTKMHLSHANRHYFCGFSSEDATIT